MYEQDDQEVPLHHGQGLYNNGTIFISVYLFFLFGIALPLFPLFDNSYALHLRPFVVPKAYQATPWWISKRGHNDLLLGVEDEFFRFVLSSIV
jgi:hypothetical protein